MPDASSRVRPARPQQDDTLLPYPGVGRARYTLGLLLVVYVLSFIDRQGISLLVGPIRADLAISDTQVSLVVGLAFAMLYTTLGIPAGIIADRGDRRLLIGSGLLLWSLATCCSGLATSFGELFAARVGVGIGEATLMPAAFSLIRDSFAPQVRGRAYSVFSMGLMVGAGLAFLFGGTLIAAIAHTGPMVFPVVGALKPWQTMLVTAGLLGLPVVLLLFTLQEPTRRGEPCSDAGSWGLGEAYRHVLANRRVYGPLVLAISLSGIVAAGFLSWMPAVIGRTWRASPSAIGIHYGLFLLVLAPCGMLAAGFLMDRLTAQGRTDAGARVGGLLAAIIVPLIVLAPIAPSETVAWMALGAYILIGTGIQPSAAAMLAALTPGRLLGQVTAFYFVIITIISALIGPTLIAGLSDYVLGGPASLGLALSMVTGVASTASAALFALTARRIRESTARMQTQGAFS